VVEGGSNLAGIDQEAGRVGSPKVCANDFVMIVVGFRSDGGDSVDYGLHRSDSCTIGVMVGNHAPFPILLVVRGNGCGYAVLAEQLLEQVWVYSSGVFPESDVFEANLGGTSELVGVVVRVST
jgi:hypothetical protein